MLGGPGIRLSAALCTASSLLSHLLLLRVPASRTSRPWNEINAADVAGFEIALWTFLCCTNGVQCEDKAPSPPDICPFSKNSPGLRSKLKQLFAKGGNLAARARPVWWLWQSWVHFYKDSILGAGVRGGCGTL